MNETEWLDYFETINNRKPSEEEIQQAKANGEFVLQSLWQRTASHKFR